MKQNTEIPVIVKGVTLTAKERKVFTDMSTNWLKVNEWLSNNDESVTEDNLMKLYRLETERTDPRAMMFHKIYPRILKMRRAREERELSDFIYSKITKNGK
jgi:hypothetical protein